MLTKCSQVQPAGDASGDALAIGMQGPGNMVPGLAPPTGCAVAAAHASTAAAAQPGAADALSSVAGLAAWLPPPRRASCIATVRCLASCPATQACMQYCKPVLALGMYVCIRTVYHCLQSHRYHIEQGSLANTLWGWGRGGGGLGAAAGGLPDRASLHVQYCCRQTA